MSRTQMLVLVAVSTMLGCASQPICPPWSPVSAPPIITADVPSPTTQPAYERATPAVQDGTTFVAGPSIDEEWISVVGESPRGEPAKPADPAPRPSHTSARRVRTATAPTKPANPAIAKSKPQLAVAAAQPALAAVPPKRESPALRAEARAVFAGRCVPCHGAAGRGDGPAGGALNPRPRNFTDKAWQASVTTGQIERIVASGGAAVGKSPLMPAQGDLAQNPELLHALALYIQELGR